MIKVLVEALVVGVSAVLMGLLVHLLFGYHAKHSHSEKMNQEMIDLVVTLFFTGFFLHLLFEVIGINSWYRRGYCKKRL